MDYRSLDSSGTDDDLPQYYQNRIPRGTRGSIVERAPMGPVSYSRIQSEMEIKIHSLEKQAYSGVLRAFKAQADALTWDKEGLITELRKELRVSDEEHRELLSQVNVEDVIQSIRDWRQEGVNGNSLAVHDPMYGSASRKKRKTDVSSTVFHPQFAPAASQLPLPAGVRGSASRGRGRSKGHNSRAMARSQTFSYRSSTEAMASESLVGRKVLTRWPDDKHFYEAVINDYNPLEGRHALVYDKGSLNETWEWVDLKEIPPEDIRWEGEVSGVFHRGGNGVVSSVGTGQGSLSNFPSSQRRIVEKLPDEVQIFHTDTLIKEVEKILDQPDRAGIEKAKSMLKEQEQSLVNLIDMLGYVSDGESDEEQPLANQRLIEAEHGKNNLPNGGGGDKQHGDEDDIDIMNV